MLLNNLMQAFILVTASCCSTVSHRLTTDKEVSKLIWLLLRTQWP